MAGSETEIGIDFLDRKLGRAGSETSAGSETAGRWSGNQDWHVFACIRMDWHSRRVPPQKD